MKRDNLYNFVFSLFYWSRKIHGFCENEFQTTKKGSSLHLHLWRDSTNRNKILVHRRELTQISHLIVLKLIIPPFPVLVSISEAALLSNIHLAEIAHVIVMTTRPPDAHLCVFSCTTSTLANLHLGQKSHLIFLNSACSVGLRL